MSANDRILRHQTTRSVGRNYIGPMSRDGYDNRVLEITLAEMEFASSEEASRFMDYQRKKYATKGQLCKGRHMKQRSSIPSDD